MLSVCNFLWHISFIRNNFWLNRSQIKARSIQFSRFVTNRFPDKSHSTLSNNCPVLSFLWELENSDSALSAKYRCEVFFCWLVVTSHSQHYGLSFFCMTDLPFVCPPQLPYVHCYSQHKLKLDSKITQETILSNSDNCFQFKKVANFVSFFNFLSLKPRQ